MHSIGLGSSASQSQPLDHEGRPLRPEDAAALVMEKVEDVCLDGLLDLKKVGMLGGRPGNTLTDILPIDSKGNRILLQPNKFISSDADEQLLLFLPFTKPVKLVSLLVRLSVKEPTANLKTIKLFTNHPHMDFQDTDSITPVHTVELPSNPGRAFTKLETKEGLFEYVVPLPMARFHGITFLTIFVETNHGANQTKLAGITIIGRDK